MREFREVLISDKENVKKIFSKQRQTACEFCFGNIFMWNPVYGGEISVCNKFFVFRSTDDKPSYSMLKGDGDFTHCIEELKKEAEQDGHRLELYAVNEEEKELLEKLFPGKFTFTEERRNFDYVYSAKDLAELSGKKFHSKRNHISAFEKAYDWQFEEITEDNIEDCRQMNEKWREQNLHRSPEGMSEEAIAIDRAFDNYRELELRGGLIRANGEVVAYSFGERLNDNTFCTHIEKAYPEIRGAYPIINRELARSLISEYEFINREQDLGLEGLRKAKLSYNPVTLVKKYRAVFEG